MTAIPAIDLMDGRCVRLTEGVFDTAKIYSDDPVSVAASFAEAGAGRLHVVDLDAARSSGTNLESIAAIRSVFPGILDVGGGIRSIKAARALRNIGADLLVVGTALVKQPGEVARWAEELGPVLVAGIDTRNGEVKISGWEDGSSLQAAEAAAIARNAGMTEIIHTDISRDGTMQGPNAEASAALAAEAGLPVIISGGIGSITDLVQLAASPPQGISGIIFGKALYEGQINLRSAVSILKGAL